MPKVVGLVKLTRHLSHIETPRLGVKLFGPIRRHLWLGEEVATAEPSNQTTFVAPYCALPQTTIDDGAYKH